MWLPIYDEKKIYIYNPIKRNKHKGISKSLDILQKFNTPYIACLETGQLSHLKTTFRPTDNLKIISGVQVTRITPVQQFSDNFYRLTSRHDLTPLTSAVCRNRLPHALRKTGGCHPVDLPSNESRRIRGKSISMVTGSNRLSFHPPPPTPTLSR